MSANEPDELVEVLNQAENIDGWNVMDYTYERGMYDGATITLELEPETDVIEPE